MTETAWLTSFIDESNRIEGIDRPATADEFNIHRDFLALPSVSIDDLVRFLAVIEPSAKLREAYGMNVHVGQYVAPSGGPGIRPRLADILRDAHMPVNKPFHIHCRYETLHPFSDGNGRSGRILWLWQTKHQSPEGFLRAQSLGFLHSFYYDSLRYTRVR